MSQNQNQNEPKIYARAKSIVESKRIRKSSTGNLWMVASSSDARKFYVVRYNQTLDALTCDCPAFTFNAVCKHLLSVALFEKGNGNGLKLK